MRTITYYFHVLPRHHDYFRHAWLAAQDTFGTFIGLRKCHFHAPKKREQPFTVIFDWDSQAHFDRFTRTWVGVWLINGMGLEAVDFFAPTRTSGLGSAQSTNNTIYKAQK